MVTQENIEIPAAEGASISGQAADWCVYLYSGQATEEGRSAFSQWIQADKAHAQAYAKVEQWWRDFDYGAGTETHEPVSALKPVQKKSAFHPGSWPVAVRMLAACLVIAFGFLLGDQFTSSDKREEYASHIGEIKIIALADGSKVTLTGASMMKAEISTGKRHVELFNGAAYFDIAPDKNTPFTVRVAQTDIKVVGTAFYVVKASEHLTVSVSEGVVDVSARKITAGQQITSKLNGVTGDIQNFNKDLVMAWQKGFLEYEGARLIDVVAEINRYRRKKITLVDPELKDMKVTMSIPIDKTDQFLTGLTVSNSVEVRKTPEGVFVTIKK